MVVWVVGKLVLLRNGVGINEADKVIVILLQPEDKVSLKVADSIPLGIVVTDINLIEAFVQFASEW